MKYTVLTYQQKLQALSDKYYSHNRWQPKKGDYYTTSRNDLELYQIVDEDEEHFYTVSCHVENCHKEPWKKEEFLQDFGINRVSVQNYILESI